MRPDEPKDCCGSAPCLTEREGISSVECLYCGKAAHGENLTQATVAWNADEKKPSKGLLDFLENL